MMFQSVGIRPEGNTSLSSVAMQSDNDRYSFKLEFDHFADGQSCFGLDKLILNNNFADATNMKEALVYDMYRFMEADASLYNFAQFYVNGEYWGVYLALEAVEESFLLRNYGELYKPDHLKAARTGSGEPSEEPDEVRDEEERPMQPAAEADDSTDTGSEEPVSGEFSSPEMGGFPSMGGGSDLNYSGEDLDGYSAIWSCAVTDTTQTDHRRVMEALKNISEGSSLERYMGIENLLKYMAVHLVSVNDDSLSGMMPHNYYLYESGGQLNILPWDYNLSFGGMNGGTATSVANEPIDDAFSATDFLTR